MNCYELLNVSRVASTREIKINYRRLISSNNLTGEQFAVIEDAYATLSDDQLRRAYDEQLENENSAPQLAVPVAESSNLVDLPTPSETSVTDTGIQSSPPQHSRKRKRRRQRGRAHGNPARTFISCVGAALAAGPIAIFILKFVFDKDPLHLWPEPPSPVSARRPVDPGNMRVPKSKSTTSNINNPNDGQRNGKPPSTEPKKATKPATPQLQTEESSKANIPMPQTAPKIARGSNNPTPINGTGAPMRDQRIPVPTTNQLAGPLSRLDRLYINELKESTDNTALVSLAKKLFMNGKLVLIQDASGAIVQAKGVERYALYKYALAITIKSGDDNQLAQICEALSTEYQIDDFELNNEITLAEFAILLDRSKGKMPQFLDDWKLLFQASLTNSLISIDLGNKTAAMAQLDLTLKIVAQLRPEFFSNLVDREQLNDLLIKMFDECLSNSEQHILNLHFELAQNVLLIAKRIATNGGGKNELLIVDKLIAKNAQCLQLHRAYEDAVLKYEKSPDDPKTNSAIAMYTILILNNWTDGLFFLARGEDTTLTNIAKIDNQAIAAAIARNVPVIPSEELKLAEQWRKLYKPNDLDGNRKEIILGRTKYWYQQTIPDLDPLEKLETEKLLKDLNNVAK
ncbi:MAG: DnaJ domain-containing protein [Planctomycetaceae bacterium]|jgi:curved DNA-binding protein CbpA|nr:DnaJ domain-containing protein [Planctomycetaceae bacterium]